MIDSRVEHVKQQLAEQEHDALIATGQANSFYFSGFRTSTDEGTYPVVVIPQDGDPQLFVSALDREAAAYNAHIDVMVPEEGFVDAVVERLPDDATAVLDSASSISFYNELQQQAAVIVDDELITDLRQVKEDAEINALQDAYTVAEQALQQTVSTLEQGMTETAVAAELEHTMRVNGSQGTAFPTIVATNAASAMPHHTVSDATVDAGPLLFDVGATVNGYRSDMSRTFHIGEPSEAFEEVYAVVKRAQELAADTLQAGVTAGAVDEAAREHIRDAGYGDQFTHSTGHGVGIDVHEAPNLSPEQGTVMEAGMVVTVEPGIYLNGEFGVRIEDAYVVTEDGAERLTTSSRELQRLQL